VCRYVTKQTIFCALRNLYDKQGRKFTGFSGGIIIADLGLIVVFKQRNQTMEIDTQNLQCRYFVTYSGVKLPFKLSQELTDAELHNRNTFFRAYFDDKDQLLFFQKMVYGESELEHRYRYDDNGALQQAEITDADGEITVLTFNETGNVIED
jgi:hypothetical protein